MVAHVRTLANYCRCGTWWPYPGKCERCGGRVPHLSRGEWTAARLIDLAVVILLVFAVGWFGVFGLGGYLLRHL